MLCIDEIDNKKGSNVVIKINDLPCIQWVATVSCCFLLLLPPNRNIFPRENLSDDVPEVAFGFNDRLYVS